MKNLSTIDFSEIYLGFYTGLMTIIYLFYKGVPDTELLFFLIITEHICVCRKQKHSVDTKRRKISSFIAFSASKMEFLKNCM